MLKKLLGKKKSQDIDTTLNKVRDIIYEILANPDIKLSNIRPDTSLEGIGFNSIKFMNLFLCLEDLVEKNIDDYIDDIDISELVTIQDIVDTIFMINNQ